MKAKRILRGLNRGIALAVVIVIVLVTYLTVQAAQFQNEKDGIRKVFEDYGNELKNVIVLPEDLQNPGDKIPANVLDGLIENVQSKMKKFYSDNVYSSYSQAENSMTYIDEMLTYNGENGVYVTEANFEVLNLSEVRQAGTGYAKANVLIKATVKTVGKAAYLNPFFSEYTNESYWEGGYESDEEKDLEKHTFITECQFIDVLLKKVGDEWKISEMNGYSSSNNGGASYGYEVSY